MEHTGQRLIVNASDARLGYIRRGGKRYHVQRLEFHAPSEHKIRGESFPLELQIVHEGQKDDLIIVSVLFRKSNKPSEFLEQSVRWKHLPSHPGHHVVLTDPFHLGSLTGLHNGYFEYMGSTTTPPCTDQVTWDVLETIQDINDRQALFIDSLFKANKTFAFGKGNNRPVQPLGGRKVTLHNHKVSGDGDGRPIPLAHMDENYNPPEQSRYYSEHDDPERESEARRVKELNMTAEEKANQDKPLAPNQSKLYRYHGRDWTGICKEGRLQSPINIVPQVGNPNGDWEMSLDYLPYMDSQGVFNTGDFLILEGNFGNLVVKSRGGASEKYIASEITFHTPSEHTYDGRVFPMEMQITHQIQLSGGRSKNAIVSVLFYESLTEASRFLDSLPWKKLPSRAGQTSKLFRPVNLNFLNGLQDGYYSYAGSLSRPPCTQGVKRFVMRTYQPMSKSQLQRLQTIFNGNARIVQRNNARGVLVHGVNPSKELTPPSEWAVNDNLPVVLKE